MGKIDRLGWAAGLSFEAFGLKIGIRVSDPLSLDAFVARIPAGWTLLDSRVVDRLYSVVTPTLRKRHHRKLCILYGDDARLIRTEKFQDLLDGFESDLDLYVAANCERPLFVHAGAIRWRQNVILLPGPSRSGKTSLVAEFLRAGASYYSDDFAPIERDGHIHPYQRPLSVRLESGGIQRLDPEDLGAQPAEPASASLVLFTQYAHGASWLPQRVSHGQAVLRMLQNTPGARKRPSLAIEVLGHALKNAEIHVGFRGEKADTVERVIDYLDHWSSQ
ncbi:MAG TPA: hypothetical protein VF133_15910 [Terriglobales bacterium]